MDLNKGMGFTMIRVLVLLCGLLFMQIGFAQQRLEIISLQNRLPEQVLPALMPLVEPGGSLTAANNKLLLRASPENIAQIRQALAAIDTPMLRLLISVRQGEIRTENSQGAGINGHVIVGPDGVRGAVRGGVGASQSQEDQNVSQRVQTVEGGFASIYLGRSFPVVMQQTSYGAVRSRSTQYVDIGSGFSAQPAVIGDRVQLTIFPQMQRGSPQGIETHALSTTVAGRLGEWIPLGGSQQAGQDSSTTMGLPTMGQQSGRRSSSTEVWLKVDVLQD